MPLTAGTVLGRYEVLEPLGAGGMGEVYRARDPHLGRIVCLKVLPAGLSSDERLRRFEQEARAAGQLNHPNILAIYDVGHEGDTPYLVTELLEGETLRQRMAGGRLPLRRVIDYAIQIGRGLAAAHERAIVHRDLKPENVFITRDGVVKILDFGLAKLLAPEREQLTPGSATLSLHTQSGVMMGTVGYMSPEQARGLPTDHRTDIFTFGALLYEMVTGQRAFHGPTAADSLSAILHSEPPALTATVQDASPLLERIVTHCMEKSAAERFQSMRDVVFGLESLSTSSTTAPVTGMPRKRWLVPAAIVLLLLVAAALAWWKWRPAGTAAVPEQTAAIGFQRLTDRVGIEEMPAISPDGRSVAFIASVEGVPQIMVQLLAGGPPLQITRDAAPHRSPRWAPDSGALIFFTSAIDARDGMVMEVPALGGQPRLLGRALTPADVSHDGKNLAFIRAGNEQAELVVTDRDGSNARVLAPLDPRIDFLSIRWSPDDRWLAYQGGAVFSNDIYVIARDGGEPRPITTTRRAMGGLDWLPDGSGLVYSSAREHTLLYLPGFNLWMTTIDGATRQLTFGEASYIHPDVDAKGRIAAMRIKADYNIWKFPIAGPPRQNVAAAARVTDQTAHVQTPSASPDGKEMVYISDTGGHSNLWVMPLEGSEPPRQITFEQNPDLSIGVPVWSPDGKYIAFYTWSSKTGSDSQWLIRPDGTGLRRLSERGGWAAWSPDSKWVYQTPGGGAGLAQRTYKFPVEGGGEPVLVRTDGAERPAVGLDGTLYFVRRTGRVAGGEELEIQAAKPENGESRLLLRVPPWRAPGWQMCQPVLSPDGKWLAFTLNDGYSTNIYLLPAQGGDLRQVTDFGGRSVLMARRLTWSPDSRFVYAAVGEGDADVVLLSNLLRH